MEGPAALKAWAEAQREWPLRLMQGPQPATVDDCNRWWHEARAWLRANPAGSIADGTRAEVELFLQRVAIYRGDLKADPLAPCFGGCG